MRGVGMRCNNGCSYDTVKDNQPVSSTAATTRVLHTGRSSPVSLLYAFSYLTRCASLRRCTAPYAAAVWTVQGTNLICVQCYIRWLTQIKSSCYWVFGCGQCFVELALCYVSPYGIVLNRSQPLCSSLKVLTLHGVAACQRIYIVALSTLLLLQAPSVNRPLLIVCTSLSQWLKKVMISQCNMEFRRQRLSERMLRVINQRETFRYMST